MRSLLHSEGLLEVLKNNLLSRRVKIEEAYYQLDTYRDGRINQISFKIGIEELHDSFCKQITTDFPTTTHAIDLPIYLENDSSKSTLMVIALDSLPPIPESNHWKNSTLNLTKEVGFWAPFSLIDNWETPIGSMRSNLSFFQPLLESYSLYITDVYKLFYRKKLDQGYQVSNRIPAYQKLYPKVHFEILLNEINLVRPHAVLVLGKLAMQALSPLLIESPSEGFPAYKISERNTSVLALPHISGAANGAKVPYITSREFAFIEGKTWNEKLARIAIHQLR